MDKGVQEEIHMTQNGNGATLRVLDQIMAGIAAVTPEQYIAPDEGPSEGEEVVGLADDYLKQFFTYRSGLLDNLKAIKEEIAALTEELEKAAFGDKNAFISMSAMFGKIFGKVDEETQQKVGRLKELEEQLRAADNYFEAVSQIFWLEIRRSCPALAEAGSIGIRSGWSLVIMKKTGDLPEGMVLGALLGGAGHRHPLGRMLRM